MEDILPRDKVPVTPVSIQGIIVDIVGDSKYPGEHTDNNLGWAKNTEALHKKGESRLYSLRKLKHICQTMLSVFLQSVVAVLSCLLLCAGAAV